MNETKTNELKTNEGILSDFLSRNRAEVIAVSIFEYDEEKHMKSEREEWREIGREEGLTVGREEERSEGLKTGLDNLSLLLKSLMDAGKPKRCSVLFLTVHIGNNYIGNISPKTNKFSIIF